MRLNAQAPPARREVAEQEKRVRVPLIFGLVADLSSVLNSRCIGNAKRRCSTELVARQVAQGDCAHTANVDEKGDWRSYS